MFLAYNPRLDPAALEQGDLVRRTTEVDAILAEVHPHYLKTDYKYFLVLTQTCDLVRRDADPCNCKSPYITIAAVRPLARAIERFAHALLRDPVEKKLAIGSTERQAKLRQFIERLLNNNATDFFFLHSDAPAPLEEHSCAFLQLSVALKAPLHYDALLRAKIAQLHMSFQHKLGYLVGTSYSRVATDDWVPGYATQAGFEAAVRELLAAVHINWYERTDLTKVLKKLKELPDTERTLEALEGITADVRRTREQRRNDVLELVERAATTVGIEVAVAQRLSTHLRNDPGLMVALKAGAA